MWKVEEIEEQKERGVLARRGLIKEHEEEEEEEVEGRQGEAGCYWQSVEAQ